MVFLSLSGEAGRGEHDQHVQRAEGGEEVAGGSAADAARRQEQSGVHPHADPQGAAEGDEQRCHSRRPR